MEILVTCDGDGGQVLEIMRHLRDIADEGISRKIRIGGEERVYDGSSAFCDIMVDGIVDTTPHTPSLPSKNVTVDDAVDAVKGAISTVASAISTQMDDGDDADTDAADDSDAVNDSSPVATPDTDQDTDEDEDGLDDYGKSVVSNVIAVQLQQRTMFTAFNITQEARRAGLRCRHRDVRSVVHRNFQDGAMDDYERTIVSLPAANNARAFVYHPEGTDAFMYIDGDDADDGDDD